MAFSLVSILGAGLDDLKKLLIVGCFPFLDLCIAGFCMLWVCLCIVASREV